MTVPEPRKTWRKSSASKDGDACVEIRNDLDAVRDSKKPTAGQLGVDVRALVRAVRRGQFD